MNNDEGHIRHGNAFLGIERWDMFWVLTLTVLAFALRFASPIYPDFLDHPLKGTPVTASGIGKTYYGDGCIGDVPIGPPDHAKVKRCGFVFDEVYFPVDATRDVAGEDYFDPEPPLSKLLMVPPIHFLGFTTTAWRLSPAIFGSLMVGLTYLIARRLRRDRWFAVVAALFVCVDGLAFTEARTGVIDAIAVAFVVLFYYVFLLHWQARTRRQWLVTLYLLATVGGLAFSAKLTALAPLAVGGALIVGRAVQPLAEHLLPWARRRAGPARGIPPGVRLWREAAGNRAMLHCGLAAALMVVVFTASFARYSTVQHNVPHYVSCTQANGPQTNGVEIPPEPVALKVTHNIPVPDVPAMVANVVDIMHAGLMYHEQECRPHSYASPWYGWPVLWHPVLFYYDDRSFPSPAGAAQTSSIANTGNPALWWMSILALLFCAFWMTQGTANGWRLALIAVGVASLVLMMYSFHSAEQPDATSVRVAAGKSFLLGLGGVVVFCIGAVISATVSRRFVPAFILLGYLAAWLMWAPGNEQRVLFLYHMLGALPFIALALAYGLTALRCSTVTVRGRVVALSPVSTAMVLVVLSAFIFFYPIWTGAPQFPADRALRIWLPRW